ncbi:MAG: sensor histidine kinase [Chitinophaga sp.]|jgi:sensor histidine kinase YesM|nr:sensor histidine kinase [Chitinophaga sp.]
MRSKISTYWLCQLAGWSAYILVWTFFYFSIRTKSNPNFFPNLFTEALCGLITTHIMRLVISWGGFVNKTLLKQILSLVFISFLFAFIFAFEMICVERHFGWENEAVKGYSIINLTIRSSVFTFLYMLIWNLIYYAYHYIQRSRKEQIDRIRLESLVKELELKTIKSHINPHFIFNALNSIRALVDENPVRARTAITELSNILRSSMQAEKLETAPFERELNIVKDYLALEHIRFEDRLRVEYIINDQTLDTHVPPMMLQTLVENAIKHGISKMKDGGLIKIIAEFKNNNFELTIENTGELNGIASSDGFGVASTHNRLSILYGNNATFELKQINDATVQAKVIIPLNNK